MDSIVRDPRASFDQSIMILEEAKRLRPDMITKSSIMVGVGETDEEVLEAMQLLRDANVDLLTIGQYLAPSKNHLAVDRFPEPERYDEWAEAAISMGFSGVACGPLVRSSYKAGLLMRKTLDATNQEEMPGAYVKVQPIPNHQHPLNPSHGEVNQ
jgi:lipoic acid synthetase